MEIIAKGQLQHHFWGDYSATIVLKFHSAALADKAIGKLPGFTQHHREPSALTFHGGGSALKQVEALLKGYGADAKKMGSLRYSVDYGEPFEIAVDIAPEGPKVEQLSLL